MLNSVAHSAIKYAFYSSSNPLPHLIRDIEVGEEITVNYNGDPEIQDPVWFEEGGEEK